MAGASEASELLAKDYSRYSINSMNCVENDQVLIRLSASWSSLVGG